jgi:putative ABC transport system permease protein
VAILRLIANWIRTRREAAALREEIETHRSLTQAELERTGLSSEEALAESRRRMGNVALALDDSRDVWVARWFDALRRNFRYGFRGLRREPAFALTAILTLAFGTAVVTVVFSVVDAEVWRPLPFPDSDRLVVLHSIKPGPRHDADPLTVGELAAWRQAVPALTMVGSTGDFTRRAVRVDNMESMLVMDVTANYFTVMGRRAIAGRVFSDQDAHEMTSVLLTSRGWERVFKNDPGAIGRTVLVDNQPRVIIGVVAADDTTGSRDGEMYLPFDERDSEAVVYGAVGRLAPDATVEVVRQQLQAEIDRHHRADKASAGHTAEVELANDFYKRTDARPLYFFLGASVFVLALTIVNLAGLVLARGVRRMPEFALRGALGGGAPVIAAQLASEAALIAGPGCLIGLWLADQAVSGLRTVLPSDLLWRGTTIPVDYRAAALVAVIIVVTIAGLAVAPLGVARRADASIVKAGGTRSGGMPWAARIRERMLVAQIALTVVLLIGGALFLKSFIALTRVPLGFDANDGWSMSVSLSADRYKDRALVRQYMDTLLAQVRSIPGVRSASVGTSSPLKSGWLAYATDPASTDETPGLRTILRSVGPTYFQTIGTPIVRGRAFTDADVTGAPSVAIVNEEFVKQFFKGADPIGRQFVVGGSHSPVPKTTVTVVGVAGNIKEVGFNEVAFADIYLSFAQLTTPGGELVVRGNGNVETMPAQLRAAAAKADPSIPISTVSPIGRRVAIALQEDRFNFVLASGFAVAALLIAGIGIYGAMAYAAVARAREFGVRLALGAAPQRLLRNALWHSARFGMAGAAIGVAVAIGAAKWIGDALYLVPGKHNGLLFNVKTTDPLVLGSAAAGMIVVALLAGFFPARRLARVNPVEALRGD